MITIPRKVEYSIEMIHFLSKHGEDLVSLTEVAKKVNLPYRFLGQLAVELKTGGVLESREGKSGGYRLAPDWGEVSLWELLSILKEDKHMVKCLDESVVCGRESGCRMQPIWRRVESTLMVELKNIKLAEI